MAALNSRVFQAVLLFAAACAGAIFVSRPAEAAAPGYITHEFYGVVSNNGKVVGAGYTVCAVVNGQTVASVLTDSQGKYGYSPQFVVTVPADSYIELYVNGVLAGTASGCISANQLDLSVYVPSDMSPPSSTSSPTSPTGTTTFFIGQQPPSSTGSGASAGNGATTDISSAVSATTKPSLTVTDLSVAPDSVTAGEEVIITVHLLNRGAVTCTDNIVLKVNDKAEAQEDITLSPGTPGEMAFKTSKNDPGTYTASVDGYSSNFIVEEAPGQVTAPPSNTPAEPQSNADSGIAAQSSSSSGETAASPSGSFPVLAVIVACFILVIILVIAIIRRGTSGH